MESNPSNPVEPVGVSHSRGNGSARQGANDVDFLVRGPSSDVDATFVEWLQPRLEHMWKTAYFRCRDVELADDLVQNAAEKLFKMWRDQDARDRIKSGDLAYLTTVVRSAYADFGRDCSRRSARVSKLHDAALDALRSVMGGCDLEIVWTVRDAVRSLDDQQRMLIYLVYYEGETVSAAGRQLELSAGKAHRVHEKALKRLRSLLQPTIGTEKASGR